jgi:hypothetical protein
MIFRNKVRADSGVGVGIWVRVGVWLGLGQSGSLKELVGFP